MCWCPHYSRNRLFLRHSESGPCSHEQSEPSLLTCIPDDTSTAVASAILCCSSLPRKIGKACGFGAKFPSGATIVLGHRGLYRCRFNHAEKLVQVLRRRLKQVPFTKKTANIRPASTKKKSLAIRKDKSGLRMSGKSRALRPCRRLLQPAMHGSERESARSAKKVLLVNSMCQNW
jgi:hypothetical protein